jgi:hypothetical protein
MPQPLFCTVFKELRRKRNELGVQAAAGSNPAVPSIRGRIQIPAESFASHPANSSTLPHMRLCAYF